MKNSVGWGKRKQDLQGRESSQREGLEETEIYIPYTGRREEGEQNREAQMRTPRGKSRAAQNFYDGTDFHLKKLVLTKSKRSAEID